MKYIRATVAGILGLIAITIFATPILLGFIAYLLVGSILLGWEMGRKALDSFAGG